MILLAFRNLFRNIRRTIAILMTVGMGAGALFCFQGFIQGVLEDYRESTIHSQYGNGQIQTKGYRDTVSDKPWKYWMDHSEELEKFLGAQEGVEHVFPRVTVPGMLIHKKVSVSGQGLGIDALKESRFFNSLNIEVGEQLSWQPDGILLGKGLAKGLNVQPGDTITLYTKAASGRISSGEFTVTGIFHTGVADFDSRAFRIQLDKAQELLRTSSIETVSVGLKDHQYWESIERAVHNQFPDLEAVSFAVLNKVYYQHSVDWLSAQFHVVQFIILSIVLLGIFNTVSASIFERKQEIGNLRANGESIFDVMRLIVCEGVFLGVAGCLLGITLSFIVAKGFLTNGILMPPGPGSTRQFFIQFSFTGQMVVSTLMLTILSAIGASTLAGLKVARMPIAKSLQST